MLTIDKNRPSPQWTESLRKRFPTEREIDRVLTRRLERRAGPAYTPLSLETLVNGVQALIRSGHIGPFEITRARWLSGGASKLQMSFVLDWERPGVGREQTRMVLRMEPSESIVETSRLREFQLIRAVQSVVPVPPVFWCDAHGDFLPYPALVYGFAEGVTKPSMSISNVSGLGTSLPIQVRNALAPQFVDHLARIHNMDYHSADLSAFDIPAPGTQCALWGLNCWERIWEEDCDEDSPMMAVAAAWLRRNLPALDQPGLVHSDYRLGNFLYTEADCRISAWLDWELGHIGDPHQDLAWTTSPAFGGRDEDGQFLVCGLMTEVAFFEAYERASGRRVDHKTLHWYKIYNAYMICTLTMGTGYRIARNGKTHQDVLVTWLIGIGYMLMDDMRNLIEKGV
ncbi:phosphotransferase family protein [Rhodoferax ferrireducens]|uniref:phosphotransferase family protein n=1 Tax=Rhodoferax ferrireducens TaxID=192843 RepID=UPI000E0DF9F4|nr:phosphotransferase family protein [Rhodoferax ferrireducens]